MYHSITFCLDSLSGEPPSCSPLGLMTSSGGLALLLVWWGWGGSFCPRTSSAFISCWSSTPKKTHCILSVRSWGTPGKPSGTHKVPWYISCGDVSVLSCEPQCGLITPCLFDTHSLGLSGHELQSHSLLHQPVTHLLQKSPGSYQWLISPNGCHWHWPIRGPDRAKGGQGIST